MASDVAKKVAGTYVADSALPSQGVLTWLTHECRNGQFRDSVQQFCRAQEEMIDSTLVVVESVSAERIQCKIPCRLGDYESTATFLSEVKFTINPVTGEILRQRMPV